MEEHEICDAIHKRRRVRFWYRGGIRIVQPYAYGVADGGHPILRAYQVSGYSRSREHGWKLFRVDEIKEFTTLDETFEGLQEGYMRNDPTMMKIYCELSLLLQAPSRPLWTACIHTGDWRQRHR